MYIKIELPPLCENERWDIKGVAYFEETGQLSKVLKGLGYEMQKC